MVNQRTTDRAMNMILGVLIGASFMLTLAVCSNTSLPEVRTESSRRCMPPAGWVVTGGRWVCSDITPLVIDELLLTIKQTAILPKKIKIIPPYAEVVWL